jgi:phosphatidylinositol alpha-mannosyltransferase
MTQTTQRWCIITPQYPPLPGTIGEHTWLLAQALTAAGDEVEVWIPPGPTAPVLPGVVVHMLPSEYGWDALRVLARAIRELPADSRVLVQYAPTAFAMRRLNLPFAVLLAMQARKGIELYFHGGGYPLRWRQSPQRSAAGVTHRLMTWLVVRSAKRVFVASPEWQRHLRRLGVRESDRDRVITWVPVPSTVPDHADPERVRTLRASLAPLAGSSVIGHFGRYGAFHQRLMPQLVERVLDTDSTRTMLLVGHGSGTVRDAIAVLRPDLARRVVATGHVDAPEVSALLAATDVLLQPYEEGASASRTSLVAGLALGCAIVTNEGWETGAIFTTRRSVFLTHSLDVEELSRAVTTLLDDRRLRAALGADARALHEELFAMSRGITRLRNTAITAHVAEDVAGEMAGAPIRADGDSPLVATTTPGAPTVLLVLGEPIDDTRLSTGAASTVHPLAQALSDGGAGVTVASPGAAPGDARYEHHPLSVGALRRAVGPLSVNLLPFSRYDVVHFLGDDWPVLRRPRATVRTVFPRGTAWRWRARLARLLARGLDRLSASRSTVAVAAGPGVAARTGISRVIVDGIDVAHFAVSDHTRARRILFIGTLHGPGRGAWLYELFRDRIASRCPDVELHLIVDIAPPSQPWLRFDALSPSVDRHAAFQGARLLVVPSTQADVDPTVLEAMASGVPVFATPTVGAVHTLGNGRFGILADDTVFADALVRLLQDETTQRRLATAARSRAEELSWPNVAAAYRDVYEGAMAYHVGVPAPTRTPTLAPAPAGALSGLMTVPGHSFAVALGERRLWNDFATLLEGAKSFVDVGAGTGEAAIYALAHGRLRRLIAIEPDRERRAILRRTLAANGFVLDPRIELASRPLSDGADGADTTLDALADPLEAPVLVRVTCARELDAVLAGGPTTLARRDTRWLVAAPARRLDTIGELFRSHGFSVHTVRTRWPATVAHWVVVTAS